MWIVLNIANSKYETPEDVDACSTKEEADALCEFLENTYGGCSDFVFKVIPARMWSEIPKEISWKSTVIKVTMQDNGEFAHEVAQKIINDGHGENEWNYPASTVQEVNATGKTASVGKPQQYGNQNPMCVVWSYAREDLPYLDLADLQTYVDKAEDLLAQTYQAQEVITTPQTVWTKAN